MSDLVVLKKQRSVNKGKLTYILNSIQRTAPAVSIEECRAKLARVEQLMEAFTAIENSIFQIDPQQDPDMEYEDNYYKTIIQLNKLMCEIGLEQDDRRGSVDNIMNITQPAPDVRLPKLNIPQFSGEYTEWQSFYDLYVSSIHNSTMLTPVQKFQYLKSLLRGEAASLLRHFSLTEANYIEALQKLRSRYDRKRHTVNAFIRTFIDQPSINVANNTNIKRLLDISDEVLRGLKALGPDGENRDPWLIYILVNKLDEETKRLWAQHTAEVESPTIQQLLDFLLRRADALDSVRISTKRIQNQKQLEVKAHFSTNDLKCTLCQEAGHVIHHCPKFQEMEVQKRRDWVRSHTLCFNCLSSRHAVFKCITKRRCLTCKGKHHSLLHLESDSKQDISGKDIKAEPVASSSKIISNYGHTSKIQAILPTVIIKVICLSGQTISCRALLDSGSQVSFITESCLRRLGCHRTNGRITVKGVGNIEAGTTRGISTILIQPETGPNFTINVFILKRITSRLPNININSFNTENWKTLQLADPEFYRSRDVDILIGIEHFFSILADGQIKSIHNGTVMQNTIFGWVVAGNINSNITFEDESITGFTNTSLEFNIDETLKRFWEIETIPNDHKLLSVEEQLCETSFIDSLKRSSEGRFEVKLPFKKSPEAMGKSISMAIQRLRGVERRFLRDKNFYNMYKQFMQEYLSLGHMTEIQPAQLIDDGFFLPHHGVIKQDSTTTKLRVVFDGSAKTNTGVSLNDCLAVGPTVQSTLYAIVLRFRENRIVFSADIEKMYRQIHVRAEDTKFQRIVWRESHSDPIRYFELGTVTYGLASAPFLATRCIQQIAQDVYKSNPIAAKTIEQNIYIDDLMSGADTVAEAHLLKSSITTIMAEYGMKLRKWVSNSDELLDDIQSCDRECSIKALDDTPVGDTSVKILGLEYDPLHDQFKFRVKVPEISLTTKRAILSEAGKIFDPLGWIAPVTVTIKIFIQQLWLLKLDWDDSLPDKEAQEWKNLRTTLPEIQKISIPRFIQTTKYTIL